MPTADVPGLFAGADALVLPDRSATASQNALIAFQFGVPVIASRAGAHPRTPCRTASTGSCRRLGDAVDLARAIRPCSNAPGALERLRAGGSPRPGPLWDDYLAALGKAVSAGQYRPGKDRSRRASPAAAPSGQRPLSAGAVPGRGCGAVPVGAVVKLFLGGAALPSVTWAVVLVEPGTTGAVLGRGRRAITSRAPRGVPAAAA